MIDIQNEIKKTLERKIVSEAQNKQTMSVESIY